MNHRKADFTVNNFEVFEYTDGELYIQTDAVNAADTFSQVIDANNGRVYIRRIDLRRMFEFLKDEFNQQPIGG